ncbi:MAG: arylsulfatase A-like enzyme [Mariniblastus sp.]|jgi:arylsulfatase A-like enzyme
MANFRLTFTTLVITTLVGSFGAASAQQTQPPNVLFIAVDDLNDWVGCMDGHPNALTPNIDALAERGTLFVNAHCQAPICGPSRASLFSGMLPSTTGIYGQIGDKNIPKASKKAAQAILMPDYFERHGYKTMAGGKLFHNGDSAKVFDEYGPPVSMGPKPEVRFKYDPAWFPEKIGSTQTDWAAYPERDDQMPDYKIAEYGVNQLKKKHDQPFFLAVGFCRPHVPFYAPKKWFEMHPIDGIKLPPYQGSDFNDIPSMSQRVNEIPAMPTTEWAIESGEWKNIVQAYLACTTFADAQVGKVLDALAASPYADNTVVIFCSDHGYHLGEKNRFAKQALWDQATKMPMIISLPGSKRDSGKKSAAAVGLIDLYPTIAQICGLPANQLNDGRSLVPLLSDANHAWPHSTITSYGRNNIAIQLDHLRFYQYEDDSMELYDHHADPNEWKNLANDPTHADTIKRMKQQIPKKLAPASKRITYPTNLYFIEKSKLEKNSVKNAK